TPSGSRVPSRSLPPRRSPDLAAMLGDDGLQCRIDVPGHAAGIAADIEAGARLQPGPQFPALFAHAVLHVDLLCLVAGECPVQPRSEEHTSELQSREKLVCRLL